MNRDEFLNRTATGGLTADDRRILLSCFDEDGNVNEEAFMDYTLLQLQMKTINIIQSLNKQVADAIREFELLKQWTNLSQIFRSLPDSVVAAARGSRFEDELTMWAEHMNTFIELGHEGRKRALELYKEEQNARPTRNEISQR